MKEKNARIIIAYSRQYSHIIEEGNAQELLALSEWKRHKVMEALSNLSKYMGCYDQWKDIRQKYQLKWSNDNSLAIFSTLMDSGKNFNAMMSWLKDASSKLPKPYANLLIFDALTGLRPDEACQSIHLIQNDIDNYLDKDGMILEHYRYPDLYIRRTKKAYISIMTDSILDIAKQSSDQGYNALRLAIKRRGLDMHMAYCRKIFATYLRNNGVEQEIIDFLQGRIPKSVFVRHYYRPDFKEYVNKIRDLLTELNSEIC